MLRSALLLLGISTLVGCGSSTAGGSQPPASGDAGSPATGGDASGGARADAPTGVPGCDGRTADGILGTWTATEIAGGAGPDGIVHVKVAQHFCGTRTAGTSRLTEDGPGFAGPGCKLVSDIRGTFTFDGAKLVIT